MPNHIVVMPGFDLEALRSRIDPRLGTHASYVNYHECADLREIRKHPDLAASGPRTIVVVPPGFRKSRLRGIWKPWCIVTCTSVDKAVDDIVQQLAYVYSFPESIRVVA